MKFDVVEFGPVSLVEESSQHFGVEITLAWAYVEQWMLEEQSRPTRGFRLSTELVAGVLVGAFIGWALDKWLGISPWGMIVFLLLGFAAGVINVMRAAGVSSGPGQQPK
jgi:F0F1-type ATP synthase assembly protein I